MGVAQLRDDVKRRVRAKREKQPLLSLRHRSEDLPPSPRSFAAFECKSAPLASQPLGPKAETTSSPFSLEALILAELKEAEAGPSKIPFIWELRRSPGSVSEEDEHLRGGLTLPMAQALYQRAQGYVVWTESEVMGGRDGDLVAARGWLGAIPPRHYEEEERGPFGPVLPEEVLIIRGALTLEAYQVYEAHILGADAFLVFPQLLSHGQLEEVIGYGEEVGLTPMMVIWDEEAALQSMNAGGRSMIVTPGDPLGEAPIASGRCLALLQSLEPTLQGLQTVLAYGPKAKPRRLIDMGEAGATGLIACARGPEILADLREPG